MFLQVIISLPLTHDLKTYIFRIISIELYCRALANWDLDFLQGTFDIYVIGTSLFIFTISECMHQTVAIQFDLAH